MFKRPDPSFQILFCIGFLLSACGSQSQDGNSTQSPVTGNAPIDLAESIQDIRSLVSLSGQQSFQIQYFDPNHLEGSMDLNSLNFLPAQKHFARVSQRDQNLKSSNSHFSGSLNCDTSDCTSGKLSITYLGAARTSLSGTANINFNQSPLLTFAKKVSSSLATTADQKSIASLVFGNGLQGGIIEQYRIDGGFFNPFNLTLFYGQNQTIVWHGTDSGSNVSLVVTETIGTETVATLKTSANVIYSNDESVQICFDASQAISAVGAYGSLENIQSPTHICGN